MALILFRRLRLQKPTKTLKNQGGAALALPQSALRAVLSSIGVIKAPLLLIFEHYLYWCTLWRSQHVRWFEDSSCCRSNQPSHNASQANIWTVRVHEPSSVKRWTTLQPVGNCSPIHQSSDKALSQWESRTEIGISSTSFTKWIILILIRRFRAAASAQTQKGTQTHSEPHGILLLSNDYLSMFKAVSWTCAYLLWRVKCIDGRSTNGLP